MGKEIVHQMRGAVDAFVAGVGKALREKNLGVRLIAIEPDEAAILPGCKTIRDHKIAGIGDGFIPEIVNMTLINEVIAIKSDEAVEMARVVSLRFGLIVAYHTVRTYWLQFASLMRLVVAREL